MSQSTIRMCFQREHIMSERAAVPLKIHGLWVLFKTDDAIPAYAPPRASGVYLFQINILGSRVSPLQTSIRNPCNLPAGKRHALLFPSLRAWCEGWLCTPDQAKPCSNRGRGVSVKSSATCVYIYTQHSCAQIPPRSGPDTLTFGLWSEIWTGSFDPV